MSWVADNGDWLDEYIADVRDRLGLAHWRIEVSGEVEDDESQGEARVAYGRHAATIYLSLPDSPEMLRETVVHELLHCQFERITWAVNNFHEVVGNAIWSVGNGAYRDALEVTIDALTSVIVPTIPLPEHEIRLYGEDCLEGDAA